MTAVTIHQINYKFTNVLESCSGTVANSSKKKKNLRKVDDCRKKGDESTCSPGANITEHM